METTDSRNEMTATDIKDQGKAHYEAWRQQVLAVRKLDEEKKLTLNQWISKVEEGL